MAPTPALPTEPERRDVLSEDEAARLTRLLAERGLTATVRLDGTLLVHPATPHRPERRPFGRLVPPAEPIHLG
jgi:hypothetical protein